MPTLLLVPRLDDAFGVHLMDCLAILEEVIDVYFGKLGEMMSSLLVVGHAEQVVQPWREFELDAPPTFTRIILYGPASI